jgi:hypothetical protein
MGQFSDACSKFEDIMQEKPDHASGEVTIVVNVHLLRKAFTLLMFDQFMASHVILSSNIVHVWLVNRFFIVSNLLALFFFPLCAYYFV